MKEKVVLREVVRYEEEFGLRVEVNVFIESIDVEFR